MNNKMKYLVVLLLSLTTIVSCGKKENEILKEVETTKFWFKALCGTTVVKDVEVEYRIGTRKMEPYTTHKGDSIGFEGPTNLDMSNVFITRDTVTKPYDKVIQFNCGKKHENKVEVEVKGGFYFDSTTNNHEIKFLENATVMITLQDGVQITQQTDEKGMTVFKNISEGIVTITISADCYETLEEEFTVNIIKTDFARDLTYICE